LALTAGAAHATPVSDKLIVRPLGLGRIVEKLEEAAEPGTISIPIPQRVIEFTSNGRPSGTVGDRITIGPVTATLTSDGNGGAAIPVHLDPGAIVENVFNEKSEYRLRFRSDDDRGANRSDSISVRANRHRLLRFNLSNRDERRGKSLTEAIPEIAFLFYEGDTKVLSDLFTISPFTITLRSTDDPAGLGHQTGADTFRHRPNPPVVLVGARATSDPVETPEPAGSALLLAGLAGLGICRRSHRAAPSGQRAG
jgi:hypothetical protein